MQSLRIAIADDEEDIREFFQRLLPRFGHEVVASAENGRELIELCHTERPNLIITDINMPEMDGLEAARQIGNSHPIPVIVVSSHDRPNELDDENNVIDFLVKPIKAAELRVALTQASQSIKLGDQL